jgi:putative transposase
LASRYERYGYRRITALSPNDGWGVNHKRVERISRQEELKVPKRQPKRGRLRPTHRNHVWSYDVVSERTHDGRPLKTLTVIDEYNRECLALLVEWRITSEDVLYCLADLFIPYGIQEHIRSDNGSEFTAKVARQLLGNTGMETLFREPGILWENGYNEGFNGKLRDEVLNREVFFTLKEAKTVIENWR